MSSTLCVLKDYDFEDMGQMQPAKAHNNKKCLMSMYNLIE
jgi:hypothetical protein